MSTTPFLTAGRVIFTLIGLSNAVSPYIADFNHTHVFNPNWPPHARFHNGQTMSLGFCLGLLTIYFAWRPVLSSTAFSKAMLRESAFVAALIGTTYWVTGLSAAFYPGAKFLDPEFIGSSYDMKILGLPGQAPVFAIHAVLAWVAYALEARRIGGLKTQ